MSETMELLPDPVRMTAFLREFNLKTGDTVILKRESPIQI